MPHIEANGLRFHVQVLQQGDHRGDGAPGRLAAPRPKVVMVHGLVADNLTGFYYTLANPVAMVADVHLYDMRGHGRSEVPETGYRVADHVGDLGALLGAWGIDEPVHLVTNSFGGVVALEFAHRWPERVASMVLIEAHFATLAWEDQMIDSLERARSFGLNRKAVSDWLAMNGDDRRMHRFARHCEHLLTRTSLIGDLQREPPIPEAKLQAIDTPTLALYGDGSDILDQARDLETHLPRCELHLVTGCAHAVLFEDTAYVRAHTLDWIGRHAVSGAGAAATTD